MNRRLLLRNKSPYVVPLGEGGYVGYDGVGISFFLFSGIFVVCNAT